MAEIIPFRGIFYNTDKINNLAEIITPPFDVITEQERHDYYDRHPHNIIRLILGKTHKTDTPDNNCHTRASAFYESWLSRHILIQDNSPALYLTSVEFSLGKTLTTRYGLIALVRLEPFEKGIVLPHEKTFSGVRSERLQLMKACHANFSPIFSLYSDNNNILDSLKDSVSNKPAEIDFTDYADQRHRMWRITDRRLHQFISGAMQKGKVYIADGHHRYETSLSYRDWVSQNNSDFSSGHPANYVMMYLSSMEDPGLTILPAHRILKGIEDSAISYFLKQTEEYFNIETIPFHGNGFKTSLARLTRSLKLNASKNAIGVFKKDSRKFYLLTLKPNIMKQKFGNELQASMQNLDVIVLTRIIFMEILGFDQHRLDDEKLITYSSREEPAIDAVISGDCDITFLLNPTKIEQVRRIAEEGLIMPRKATYFYPKVITGLVLNRLA